MVTKLLSVVDTTAPLVVDEIGPVVVETPPVTGPVVDGTGPVVDEMGKVTDSSVVETGFGLVVVDTGPAPEVVETTPVESAEVLASSQLQHLRDKQNINYRNLTRLKHNSPFIFVHLQVEAGLAHRSTCVVAQHLAVVASALLAFTSGPTLTILKY